ncbi:hypothetical protein ASE55_16665 [Chryseobacterium sp. Leaf201]|nr:hypothetical protein ASE55_16665 [Chryseobacterium sp. Leaf201]
MNILSVPYFAGGLSHLLPLYVLHHKYLKKCPEIGNQFLVNNNLQFFLKTQRIECPTVDYFGKDKENLLLSNDFPEISRYVIIKEQEAYERVNPQIVIEDNSFTTPLIAEKKNIPRISIQRTGTFRSIDVCYRNPHHVHSMQKGININRSAFLSDPKKLDIPKFDNSDTFFLQKYFAPKAKIIPGIASIERLPENIEDRDSYFYSGPLIVMDKPSKNLSEKLGEFLESNKDKSIVFITTGTIDKTPIDRYIEFFVKQDYAVITTCNCEINKVYPESIFHNNLLPLHYICGISNLVIHQCGSGMYHYPIINGVPSLTIGTQCFDREDIALRLQELGVSSHIPHPEDNPDYWEIFLETIDRFERKELINFKMMDQLKTEIEESTHHFNIQKVINYALS